MKLISPEQLNHVNGLDNPADYAPGGLFSSELLNYSQWWNGPDWFLLNPVGWPNPTSLQLNDPSQERDEICVHATLVSTQPLIPSNHFSDLTLLKKVTAWLMCSVRNCQASKTNFNQTTGPLTVQELKLVKLYWISISQEGYFAKEVRSLKMKTGIPLSSCLLPLNPF